MANDFSDNFDTFNQSDWFVSDFAIEGSFINTAWSSSNLITEPGTVTLELNNNNLLGKSYTGAEFRSQDSYHYGRYEVTMQPSTEKGVLSSFFLYTGPFFNTPLSEIDIEFLGKDTTEVLLTFHTPEGQSGETVDLGFDAALAEHTYAIEWGPDSISWYADDVLLRTVVDPEIGTPAEPSNIFMNIWTGTNSFTGTPNFSGTTSATYSDVSFVARTAPVALNERADTGVGQSIDIDVLANDSAPNGSLVTGSLTIVGAPTDGTVSVDSQTGVVTYTPDANFQGIDTFSYTVTDGTEVSNSGDVTVVVGKEIYETFSTGPGPFTYSDDLFYGSSQPNFADGVTENGLLRVFLGGSGTSGPDISGGWSTTFSSVQGQSATLTVTYRLSMAAAFDLTDFGEALVAIDGVSQTLAQIQATNANQETLDTGFVTTTLDFGVLSAGTHTLDLGGYINARNGKNEIAVIAFDDVDLTLNSPSPADDDGNLTLSTSDTLVDTTDASSVTFTISGLDADATAVVTVTDGVSTVTGNLASDGNLSLDLSGLAIGLLNSSVTATDVNGAMVTIAGPEVNLVPASADEDGNLTLSAPDISIDGSESPAVIFNVFGLDSDATAVVTVTDGVSTVTSVTATDGDIVLDLSGLADGPLTSSITATDGGGAMTTINGPVLSLSSVIPDPNAGFSEDFANGPGTFTYADDLFNGSSQPNFANGVAENGLLTVSLGGSGKSPPNISGGWTTTFDTVPGQTASITITYRLQLAGAFDQGDLGQALFAIDGVSQTLAQIEATNVNQETLDTGFVTSTIDLGVLSAGSHTLDLGGHINMRDGKNEIATISFDDVAMVLSSPSPADDDGNLALTSPDLSIDGNESSAVLFTVSGLDSDATAIVTVSDGSSTVTAATATDGDVTLDLSALSNGPLTTSVSATDGNNATATVSGPQMVLVPASADEDGNLTLSAPDVAINGSESTAVEFLVTGLDNDATAVVTVSDGVSALTSNVSADGSIILDISSLADGPLTTSITATDTGNATATVSGPAITLTSVVPDVDFSTETEALSIDMAAGTYSYAAKVLLLGDSLTYGWLGDTDPEVIEDRPNHDGYRGFLFDEMISQGNWIDYVGNTSSGPDDLLDMEHSAVPGEKMKRIANSGTNPGSIKVNVPAYDPDVTILMAGTNDIGGNETRFFDKNFPTLIAAVNSAVSNFYANSSVGSHFVISTIPPKLDNGTEEFARIANEGYSVVNGVNVVGDAGNGTYQPGIKATVEALQTQHPTLHIYDAPFSLGQLGEDGVHLNEAAYKEYAAGLNVLLDSEIGFSGGTLDGTALSLGAGNILIGGQAGDLIQGSSAGDDISGGAGNDVLEGAAGDDVLSGDDGTDRIEGGAGLDTVSGGAGMDFFVFDLDFANGHSGNGADSVLDFGTGADRFVFHESIEGSISVADDPVSGGVILTVGTIGSIVVQGTSAQSLKGTPQGGGVFDILDDPNLVSYGSDTDPLIW